MAASCAAAKTGTFNMRAVRSPDERPFSLLTDSLDDLKDELKKGPTEMDA